MSRIMENDRQAEASQEEPRQWTSREVLDLLAADGILGDRLNEQSRRSWSDCDLQDTLGFVFGQLLELFEENAPSWATTTRNAAWLSSIS